MAPTGTAKLYLALRLVGGLVWNLIFLGCAVFAAGIAAGTFYRDYGDLDSTVELSTIPAYAWVPPAALTAPAWGWAGCSWSGGSSGEAVRRAIQEWITRLLIAGVATGVVLVGVPLLIMALRAKVPQRGPAGGRPGRDRELGERGGGDRGRPGPAPQPRRHAQGAARRDGKGQRAMVQAGPGHAPSDRLPGRGGGRAGARAAVLHAGSTLGGRRLDRLHPLLAGAIALAVFVFSYLWCDLTTWSLHPYYKRRLASVFALKRVQNGDETGP